MVVWVVLLSFILILINKYIYIYITSSWGDFHLNENEVFTHSKENIRGTVNVLEILGIFWPNGRTKTMVFLCSHSTYTYMHTAISRSEQQRNLCGPSHNGNFITGAWMHPLLSWLGCGRMRQWLRNECQSDLKPSGCDWLKNVFHLPAWIKRPFQQTVGL